MATALDEIKAATASALQACEGPPVIAAWVSTAGPVSIAAGVAA